MDKLLSVIFMVGVLLLVLPGFFTIKFKTKTISKKFNYLDYYNPHNFNNCLFF
jgi:hypothetical protein